MRKLSVLTERVSDIDLKKKKSLSLLCLYISACLGIKERHWMTESVYALGKREMGAHHSL